MNLTNYFWYFKSALTPRFCDEVIKHGLAHKEKRGLTGESDEKNLNRIRRSNVAWIDDPWIYKEIHPFVTKANKEAGWNFEWDRSEQCQFTKYKQGQYYDWHSDSFPKPHAKGKDHPETGKIRKLSMTCQLTDGSEYKGGEVEFDFKNYAPHLRDESKHRIECKEILPKGSIIVFPSFVWHRVKPIMKGTRYSLVVWHLGYPFK